MVYVHYFFPEYRSVLRDDVERHGRIEQATGDDIIRRMRFACWITKATDTHSEYIICIAFSQQEWLRERASKLRYTYAFITCLVYLETKSNCWDRNHDHPVCYRTWKRRVACHILTNQYFSARNTISYCIDLGSFHIS